MEESVAAEAAAPGEVPPLPGEEAEHAMLAELRARGEIVTAAPAEPAEDGEAKQGLPALDSLVQRIPTEARELLDDLFRARFTAVRKVPAKALKT